MDDDEYYFSDLTDLGELSENSETQETRPAKNKAKGNLRLKAKSPEFTIRGALKPGRMTTCSTEALYKNGRINLNPDYQRDVVWPESRQVGVIRTIFQNYPMNPVLFNVITHDDGTEMRTCIDGKQRLTSICRFRQGLIFDKNPDTGEKWWYCDNPKVPTRRAKNILAEKHRNVFDGKMVTCTEYQDLSDADEREIFQRVQLGVALTPAEKLRVVATPRTEFVRKLKDDFLNDTSALASLAWDRSRGSDLRCLAQTIQCIAISKTSSFQATQKWLEDPTPLAHAFTANIENTYRVFEMLAQDPRHHTVFAKISPVEFIHVGILVHRHKARLTLDAMVKAIAAIRADVRNTHHEIRNNSKVNKTMHKFIDEYQGHTVKRGDVSAADAVRTNPTRSVGASTSAKAGTKRKATCALPDGDDDDSDDDYAPTLRVAPRKRAATAKTARASAPIPISIPGASTPAAASAGNAPSLHTIPASKKCIVARRLGADASVNAGVSGCCRLALTKGA